jgi:curved DNA-binding protein
MAGTRDLYEVLGVARGASQEEIQRAYRQLARRHHPDVSTDPTSGERFKELTAAYEVLSDPVTRARYDRDRGRPLRGRPVRVRTGPARDRVPDRGSGHLDIADLLGGFGPFPAGRSGYRAGAAGYPAADVESEVEISVEDAYTGGHGLLTLDTPVGVRQVDVTVPPGVTDGQRIRIPGYGATLGGHRGDLHLVVRLAAHPRYRVDGRDLAVDLAVTPWEAVLGANLPVQTPAGTVRVELPPGSSTGRRLRLRGHGLPDPNGPPGDLYAEVRIVVPTQPSPPELALYRRLARESSFNPRAG